MDVSEKLGILADSAKYDVSCSSSGSERSNTANGIGNGAKAGICHSWAEDGRCISLLKILLTNYCLFDCAYCVNRKSNDIKRTVFTAEEIVELTINFYKRNYIEGLFLSSGIIKSPDYTMEQIFLVVKKLRTEKDFHGYIHIKAIPGASNDLIKKTGFYADRMSINIELPSENSLKLLAPDKNKEKILDPMFYIGKNIFENKEERKTTKKLLPFVPAGQSTQLIVGASPENDYNIMNLASNLYGSYKLKRVYYSAYIPTANPDKRLLTVGKPPLRRENRLYQADWLLRFYNFKVEELFDENNKNFDENFDPKLIWALRNLAFFPVEINKDSFNKIIRVPGIGIKSAYKIIYSRKFANIKFDDLKRFGVVLKRAKYFITCSGKYFFNHKMLDDIKIKNNLMIEDKISINPEKSKQLLLFGSNE